MKLSIDTDKVAEIATALAKETGASTDTILSALWHFKVFTPAQSDNVREAIKENSD